MQGFVGFFSAAHSIYIMENNLKFNNGKFTILALGDLHEKLYIETYEDRKRLEDMYNLVEMGIKAFKPDLVVLLGDTCCSHDDSEGFKDYKTALNRILKPVLEAGVPFAHVLGNHEHDTQQEELIIKSYSEIPTCLSPASSDSPDDLSYNLLVKSSDGKEDILNLWFIDSNNLRENPNVTEYDYVHEDQIAWYEKKAEEIKNAHGGKTVPAILFQHMPVFEEYNLLREAKIYERPVAVKGYNTRSDKYYVKKDGVEGYLGEGPCAPDENHGQFESWKKVGDVKGAFFGHDHLNDFTGKVDGIMLGQNKTSGFRAYTDGCRCLVRTITVKEENPEEIVSKVYHYKELGLQCHCLGPIESRINDRQSMAMHKIGYAAAAVSGVAGLVAAVKKFKK